MRGEPRRVSLMTNEEKVALFNLLDRFTEERNCSRNCEECFYRSYSPVLEIDDCPLITSIDMIYRNIYDNELWRKRVGAYNEME